MKVSWQVTGIRHDTYADAHRIPVEELKSAARAGQVPEPRAVRRARERGTAQRCANGTGEHSDGLGSPE